MMYAPKWGAAGLNTGTAVAPPPPQKTAVPQQPWQPAAPPGNELLRASAAPMQMGTAVSPVAEALATPQWSKPASTPDPLMGGVYGAGGGQPQQNFGQAMGQWAQNIMKPYTTGAQPQSQNWASMFKPGSWGKWGG